MRRFHRASSGFVAALTLVACFLLTGCHDPVQSQEQDALGPEEPGVPRGPLHRPGQPCLVCHDGGTASEFSVAGTVYTQSTAKEPLRGGVVTLTDADGQTHWTSINCAGNFYISPEEFTPRYPMTVFLSYDDPTMGPQEVPMISQIHREGSCGACHHDPAGRSSPGHVYFLDGATPPDISGCR